MASRVSKNTFSNVYKDDFADSDNFHRILFNSGRSLQARELTQLQTIIQKEIQRFGDNIFVDGAAVNPKSAGINIDFNYKYVKLSSSSNDFDGLTTTSIVGKLFEGSVSGIVIRVLEAVETTGGDPATIYVKYEKTPNANFSEIQASETLTATDASGKTLLVQATNPVGDGLKVNVSGGDFYVSGHFVYARPQSIIISKYTNTGVNANVGYKIVEEVVTATDDTALYDNQGVNPNLSAPGADRYRIRLTLTTEDQVASTDTFIKFFEIVNSKLGNERTGLDDYNKITQVLARRTREESGNYLVEPFLITFLNGDSDGSMFLDVDPFVAYVNGNRVVGGTTNTNADPYFIPKPRSITSSSQYSNTKLSTRVQYSNYVTLDNTQGLNLYDGDLLSKINIYDNNPTLSTATLGTTRVMQIERVDDQYRAFLFNTNVFPGNTFRDATAIGTSAEDFLLLRDQDSAVIENSGGYNLLVPLLKDRVAGVTNVTFEVQREFTQTATGGVITLVGDVDESFQDVDNWIFVNTTDDTVEIVPSSSISLTEGNGVTQAQAQVTGLGASDIYKVLTYVKKKSPVGAKTKTLTTSTVSTSLTVDSSGTYIDLGLVDIYELDSVKDSANGLMNLRSSFVLDNGQRDNFYEPGRLVLKTSSIPSDTVYAKFKHFTHSAGGDYFSVASYNVDSDFVYSDIPTYTTNDGLQIRLSDVLDFRSSVNRAKFVTTEIEPPRNGSIIEYNMSSYNARVDVLVATSTGATIVKKGVESLEPTAPLITEEEMPLYTIRYGANTLSVNDINVTPFIHKRFTMRDISDLEKRVERLEEATSLSLLETKTQDLLIQASDGTVRAKSGFFVDNFKDFPAAVASETSAVFDEANMTQSIDFKKSFVFPKSATTSIGITYDSDNSTNIKRIGDNIYLAHKETSTPLIKSEVISNTKNVNPFMITVREGVVKLSPSSDNWVDTRRLPNRIVQQGTQVVQTVPSNGSMNWWQFGWNGESLPSGSNPNTVRVGQTINSANIVTGTNTTQTTRGWTTTTTQTTTGVTIRDRVTGIDTIRKVLNDRVVESIFLPFMRQKKIYFKATGLRPNTKHYPFFDGVDVTQWCREEPSFLTANRLASDDFYDEIDPSRSEHPAGSSELISDDNGTIIGSFFLPNTGDISQSTGGVSFEDRIRKLVSSITGVTGVARAKHPSIFDSIGWRFRVGSRTFKLLDLSQDNEQSALSFAKSEFNASGRIDLKQTTIGVTRQVVVERTLRDWKTSRTTTNRPRDPIAQTFYVDTSSFPQGMFVSSVQVFMKSAPSETDVQVPIQLQLRGVTNGTPDTNYSPDAVATLTAAEVRSAISGQSETQASVLLHPVTFRFDEPVFLPAGDYYSMVLIADTDKYEAYISTVFNFELGSTSKRVSKQPTLGSFFESQNGSTWTPLQNSDLAYRINHLTFVESGVAKFINNKLPRYTFGVENSLLIDSGSSKLFVKHPSSGLLPGDHPKLRGLDSATKYAGILGSSIMSDSLSIDSADTTGYTLLLDSAATDSAEFGPSSLTALRNVMFDKMHINMNGVVLPSNTNISQAASYITGQSYANDNNITNNDTRFNLSPSSGYNNIQLNENILFTEPKMIANDSAENTQLAGNKSFNMQITFSSKNSLVPIIGSGDLAKQVSPVIDMQRATAILTNNLIDNQDSVPSASTLTNRPINFVAETSPLSGSSPSKHIIKPTIIAEPAIGLKVLFDGYRPQSANFDVYYRVCQADENIYDLNWIIVDPVTNGYGGENDDVVNENEIVFGNYEYFCGDNTGITPVNDISSFTQFQVKIVMRSTNTSRVPILSNVRAIALAT